ncbi:MAG: DUF4276 family protein [Armatimonadota bacterium]
MIRLNVVVEGQTERAFVQGVLRPFLWESDIHASPLIVRTSRESVGGVVTYGKVRRLMVSWMKQQPTTTFTTMFDLYALPSDWPSPAASNCGHDAHEFAEQVEQAMCEDIDHWRFIPYVQVHEFEALLLVEPSALLKPHPDARDAVSALEEAVAECGGPELVNDGPETHPSQRIERLIPRYKKALHGPQAARAIGIDRMRDSCPHFNEWIERLIELAP